MTSSVQLDDGVDLKDLWQVLIDFRKLIGLTAFSFTIIAYIYSLTIIPTYLSEVLVVPVDQESSASNLGGLGGLAALAGLQVEKIDPVRTQMAIFESRKFIEKFIEEEDLLPLLFSENWDKEKKKWTQNPPPTVEQGFYRYSKVQSVRPDGDLFMIVFEMIDPKIAADLANRSVERLNNYSRNKAIIETEKSIGFLENEINQTNITNAQKFLFTLIEEQTKNRMLASVREEYVFEVIDPATVPKGTYRPNRTQISFIGGFLGFLLTYMLGMLINIFGLKIPYLVKYISK